MNIDNNNTRAAPVAGKTPWYKKVKEVLTVVSRVILTAPVKIPAKIKAGAQYVAILLGILDSLEKSPPEDKDPSVLGEAAAEATSLTAEEEAGVEADGHA